MKKLRLYTRLSVGVIVLLICGAIAGLLFLNRPNPAQIRASMAVLSRSARARNIVASWSPARPDDLTVDLSLAMRAGLGVDRSTLNDIGNDYYGSFVLARSHAGYSYIRARYCDVHMVIGGVEAARATRDGVEQAEP